MTARRFKPLTPFIDNRSTHPQLHSLLGHNSVLLFSDYILVCYIFLFHRSIIQLMVWLGLLDCHFFSADVPFSEIRPLFVAAYTWGWGWRDKCEEGNNSQEWGSQE